MEKVQESNHVPYGIFKPWEKRYIIFIVSMAASVSGMSSNIYFPAIPTIARDLSTSNELVDLSVTSYMILQGVSPSLWGSLADVVGRRIVYI